MNNNGREIPEVTPFEMPESDDDMTDEEFAAMAEQALAHYKAEGERLEREHPEFVQRWKALTEESARERDANDPRLREMPQTSPSLLATFKWEHTEDDGELTGPLIVYDPDADEVVWETSEWVHLSEAEALAREKGWEFNSS